MSPRKRSSNSTEIDDESAMGRAPVTPKKNKIICRNTKLNDKEIRMEIYSESEEESSSEAKGKNETNPDSACSPEKDRIKIRIIIENIGDTKNYVIQKTEKSKENSKSTPSISTRSSRRISTCSSVDNESTPRTRGRKVNCNEEKLFDAKFPHVLKSPQKGKKRNKPVTNVDTANVLKKDQSDDNEIDENNMDNANKVSPSKRQKVLGPLLETPSKSTTRYSAMKTPSSAAPKNKAETPYSAMRDLSINAGGTPRSRNPPKKRLDLGRDPEISSKRSDAVKKKSKTSEYNDFESDREPDDDDESDEPIRESASPLVRGSRCCRVDVSAELDRESESGDDGDEDYKQNSTESSEEESFSDDDDDDDDSEEMYSRPNQRKKPVKSKTPSKNLGTPSSKSTRTPKTKNISIETPTKQLSRLSLNKITPSVHRRVSNIAKPTTPLQQARQRLHVSVLPKSLPCREEQFNDIYTFLRARLSENSGGCMYVSGVPGTGKTATVNEVIRVLRKEMDKGDLPEFKFVDINGMKLSEPRQAYNQIWKHLTGESRTWEDAQKMLQNRFSKANSKRGMTLLLVDELDLLCTKRQDVVYNLLDWPSKQNAKLVVVTIANTMDLPERILMGKVASRLGLTRLTFQAYNFKQLEQIVLARLKNQNTFDSNSIQFVARKVAAVSGDARRALDICRRSTEIAEINGKEMVTMDIVEQALNEMIARPKVQAIKHCSKMEKYFLQAVCAEVQRTGVEEVVFQRVYSIFTTVVAADGLKAPNVTQALFICARLGSYRLLITEHSRQDIYQRVIPNVSEDDVHFAISEVNK